MLREYVRGTEAQYVQQLPSWLQTFDVGNLLGRAALVGVRVAEKVRSRYTPLHTVTHCYTP